MVFDPVKFEGIHFSRKQNFPNPEIVLLPTVIEERPRIIRPVAKKGSMRWLGVYFDPRLSEIAGFLGELIFNDTVYLYTTMTTAPVHWPAHPKCNAFM